MATGDQNDIARRLTSLLPARWFSTDGTVIASVVAGLSAPFAAIYSLYTYAKTQTRVATATGFWLDLIAFDFFGLLFQRRTSQPDDNFRAHIVYEVLRARATRPGMSKALLDLTGTAPIIFEPWNPGDTGVYNGRMMGYSVTGRYGSLQHPGEVFLDVKRPLGQGIPGVEGYGANGAGWVDVPSMDPPSATQWNPLATLYGFVAKGAATPAAPLGQRSEWASLSMLVGPVTDLQIYQMVERTRAAGTRCWVRISDVLPPPDLQPAYGYLLDPTGQRLLLDDGGAIITSGPT